MKVKPYFMVHKLYVHSNELFHKPHHNNQPSISSPKYIFISPRISNTHHHNPPWIHQKTSISKTSKKQKILIITPKQLLILVHQMHHTKHSLLMNILFFHTFIIIHQCLPKLTNVSTTKSISTTSLTLLWTTLQIIQH